MCRALLGLFAYPTITWDHRQQMAKAMAHPTAPSQWPKSIAEWQQRAEKLLTDAMDPKPRNLVDAFRELSLVEAGAQAASSWTEETLRGVMLAGGVSAPNPALVAARAAVGDAGVLSVTSNTALRVLMDRARRELCGES